MTGFEDGYVFGVWQMLNHHRPGRYVSLMTYDSAVRMVGHSRAEQVFREIQERLDSFHDLDVPRLRRTASV